VPLPKFFEPRVALLSKGEDPAELFALDAFALTS
jgi:hypothetical protein